jgi:hypothetical protein
LGYIIKKSGLNSPYPYPIILIRPHLTARISNENNAVKSADLVGKVEVNEIKFKTIHLTNTHTFRKMEKKTKNTAD